MDYLIVAAFLGVACYYPVCVMLLNFKGGPFTDFKILVEDHDENNGAWPVSLFDRIRRLFGVYYIGKDSDQKERWYVELNNWSELFRCPYCLSFWFAFPFSLFLGFHSGEWLWFPIYHLIITSVSIAWNRYV